MSLPVAVINGRYSGPHVWVSAAIHGDELNGVAVVRRVISRLDARRLHGAVIAVPIVNVFGFINQSRYLPDRRDLNRSFPGSTRGSLAARLARLFLTEVVEQCTVGIDLHTAAGHRANVPQLRCDIDDAETLHLAKAFGTPFVIHAKVRDGSLRQAATEGGKRVLLYEAGQVLRFEDRPIEIGEAGVLRVLSAMGMGNWAEHSRRSRSRIIRRTTWVRARRGGIADMAVELGQAVVRGQTLATVGDAFTTSRRAVTSPADGWVIAVAQNPLVSQGDALVHIAIEGTDGADEPAERLRRPR